MSSRVRIHNASRRPLAMLTAALALGAGGGAATALLLDGGSTTTVTRVEAATPATASAAIKSTSALTVNQIYRGATNGVVDITVSQGPSKAEGSGFVIDKQGDIVTNQHVVSSGGSIQVKFADGRKASARLVGSDPSSDVAVIKVSVPSSALQPLTFGDSSKVQVGDGVVAIGSPFGLAGTVTTGVVSALDRSIAAPNHYTITGAIQTDAPINRGNSGGPLLDSHGNVIGVNSQIDSNSGDSSGVGFAVSSNTARRVAETVIGGGKVQHPYLGVGLTDASGGAGIASVASGSPAAHAGLRQGDVITAIAGKRVGASADAVNAIDARRPGDKLALTIQRGGAEHVVQVTLVERPS
jgi:putative serine protease PepD